MGERLILRALVIVGPSRDYSVRFQDGVNVIAGPVMTGKSTTLRLVDYALGARRPPEIPELAKCSVVQLECAVGGEILTIERSLRNPSALALLFEGDLVAVKEGSVKGLPVAPRHTRGQKSISSEIMRRLGLGELRVKEAPTQEASDLSTFSLRDLLSLLYLDQTRISDDKSAFFEREVPKAIKWKAGFEVLFELYDTGVSQLGQALKDAHAEQQAIERYLDGARHFLDDAQVPSTEELQAAIQTLGGRREELVERQGRLRGAAEVELGDNLALVQRREARYHELETLRAQSAELKRSLEQLGRLRVQYEREREQLAFLEEADRLIGSVPVSRCPACLQATERLRVGSSVECYLCHTTLAPEPESVSVEARLRANKRRITDLEQYLSQLRETQGRLERSETEAQKEVRELTRALERVQQTTLLPSARMMGEVGAALAIVERELATTRELLFLRERAKGQGSALLAVRERARRLQEQLSKLREEAPDAQETLGALAELFRNTLRSIRFPYLDGVGGDPGAYQPIVRGARYGAVSSKGAVSLIVSSWHLAMIRLALSAPSRHPMLLMLDSPLSHVGRDSADPEFKDQQMVDAFYQLLGELHRSAASAFQIVLCDNHPPSGEPSLIIEQFTRDPSLGRYGLIEDEHGEEVPDSVSGSEGDAPLNGGRESLNDRPSGAGPGESE